jgi:carbon monoxide dehydrogenase subunit G
MAPIVVSTDVDRPAADVFAYATDPTRFSEWQKGVVDGHVDQPGTPRVGARCSTTRRIGFAERSATSELVYIDPPKTWGVRGADGPIRAKVDVQVEALGETRSRLTITVDFDGHGIGKVLVPLVVRREARKEMPANVAKLKQRLETPQSTVRGAGVGE